MQNAVKLYFLDVGFVYFHFLSFYFKEFLILNNSGT